MSSLNVLGLSAFTATSTQAAVFTFQQGIDGYTGTQDTELQEGNPSANFGSADSVSIDGDNPGGSGNESQGLIRFDNIFGSGIGQIPSTYEIMNATLSVEVTSAGSGIRFVRMLQDWNQSTVTWNTFGSDGITPNSSEATDVFTFVGANNSTANVPTGLLQIDVTSSVQAWGSGNDNFGLGLLPFPLGSNGIDFDASEFTTVASRPILTINAAAVPESSSITGLLILAAFPLVKLVSKNR